MIPLKGKKIAVLGLAEEGLGWAQALAKGGALVSGFGRRTPEEIEKIRKKFEKASCQFYWDKIEKTGLMGFDLVLHTPGSRTFWEALEFARENGVETCSDLDMAVQAIQAPVIAVTGTNGKSTTVAMLQEMLKAEGFKVLVLGGDFSPWVSALTEKKKIDFCLMEVSSRRLEVSDQFHPHIALFLNLFQAHGERHEAGYLGYVKAKAKIFSCQTEKDYLIHEGTAQNLNELVTRMKVRAQRVRFSLQGAVPPPGIFLEKTSLVWNGPNSELEIYSLDKARNRTPTHISNLMAAVAAARLLGVGPKNIQAVIDKFSGLPHRLQMIRMVGGVVFVDDSRATNVAAVIWALHSLPANLFWIAGGAPLKSANWDELLRSGISRVKEIFLYGSAVDGLAATLQSLAPVTVVKDVEEAVKLAQKKAGYKDIVVFSPGCLPDPVAGDYKVNRGDRFIEAVKKLKAPPSILQKTSASARKL